MHSQCKHVNEYNPTSSSVITLDGYEGAEAN